MPALNNIHWYKFATAADQPFYSSFAVLLEVVDCSTPTELLILYGLYSVF